MDKHIRTTSEDHTMRSIVRPLLPGIGVLKETKQNIAGGSWKKLKYKHDSNHVDGKTDTMGKNVDYSKGGSKRKRGTQQKSYDIIRRQQKTKSTDETKIKMVDYIDNSYDIPDNLE